MAVLTLWPHPAMAQAPKLEAAQSRPWAKGVPESEQKLARASFEKGTEHLMKFLFEPATQEFREALGHWDHPVIHYNLSLALGLLNEPIEAHAHVEKALLFGPAPLEQERFQQALNYKAKLERQLAWVEIQCNTPGAEITLDQEKLPVEPEHPVARWVQPGKHLISASKAGRVTTELHEELAPGSRKTVSLPLFEKIDLIEKKWRMPEQVPFEVAAGGAALAAGGVLFHFNAWKGFTAFDRDINACGGCVPSPELATQHANAVTFQRVALGGYAVGGAALITGAVMLLLNQPEIRILTPEEYIKQKSNNPKGLSVAPRVTGSVEGSLITFHF